MASPTWIHAAAEATGLPDASFDLVSAHLLFHELPQSAAIDILREARRLPASGGVSGNHGYESAIGNLRQNAALHPDAAQEHGTLSGRILFAQSRRGDRAGRVSAAHRDLQHASPSDSDRAGGVGGVDGSMGR